MTTEVPIEELQLAVIIIPVLAAIVGLVVNTLEEDDPLAYRIVLTGLGMGAFIPALLFTVFAVLSSEGVVDPLSVIFYMLASVSLVLIILLYVIYCKSVKGLDDREDRNAVKIGSLGIVLIITVVLWGLSP